MKAIILPVAKPEALEPLTTWVPEFLFPVVNKPILEHLIELLVRHHIKDIVLVHKHMPLETEQYFGNGQRWGARISYSLAKEFRGVGASLRPIRSKLDEPFLCLPGNIITNMDLSGFTQAHGNGHEGVTLGVQGKGEAEGVVVPLRQDAMERIKGFQPFIMTPEALSRFLDMPPAENEEQEMSRALASLATVPGLELNQYLSSFRCETINSIADYLEANQQILKEGFPNLILPGSLTKAGLWVDRYTKIHPDAEVCSPSVVGSHCRIHGGVHIGQHTVIGNNVIVDTGASVEGSIIMDNTYIGSHTEIKNSIIRKNTMFDVPRSLNVYVGDDAILGDLDKEIISSKVRRLIDLSVAVLLLLLFSPLMALLSLYHILFPSKGYLFREERFGDFEIVDHSGNTKPKAFVLYSFRSRNLLVRKLPWLLNVIKGHMNLVGNAPLSGEQITALEEEWETLRFKVGTGLFHSWEVEGGEDITWEEILVMENYYASTRSFLGDAKILLRSLLPYRKGPR